VRPAVKAHGISGLARGRMLKSAPAAAAEWDTKVHRLLETGTSTQVRQSAWGYLRDTDPAFLTYAELTAEKERDAQLRQRLLDDLKRKLEAMNREQPR
jgi:hypothetical protein